ncbi:MerR-like DNA binding protein [Streptomyces sp. Amel2xB2]|uniref:MerR family transcriptional regulator n=1 Tax=Streptomyces sp. Amel2xB2 TaxID=1305829 RepID=UPI000DB9656F|nr:MerR family transcriptional regulator [Streptomyces sp. Amel2xB2]RAJ62432.1 MerR-like DNA binding protein [Streptomyces sp. Amel2xB2]
MADDRERAQSRDAGSAGVPAGGGHGNGTTANGNGGGEPREYRAAELAELAGITTRTLRFYRERKLLPPPRREGRIAFYDEHHLARLRTITGLLERGHTLGGIADLIGAFESGRDSHGTAELLGLESALLTSLFAEETPIRLTPEELADYYQGEVTVENLATSLDIGYIAVDGDEFIHTSRRLLDASSELVKKGIPLAAVLAAGRELRTQSEAIAEVFAELFTTHLLPQQADASPDGLDAERLNDLLTQVRPLAKQVVEAELGLALDRRVRDEIEKWLAHGQRSEEGEPSAQDDTGTD